MAVLLLPTLVDILGNEYDESRKEHLRHDRCRHPGPIARRPRR